MIAAINRARCFVFKPYIVPPPHTLILIRVPDFAHKYRILAAKNGGVMFQLIYATCHDETTIPPGQFFIPSRGNFFCSFAVRFRLRLVDLRKGLERVRPAGGAAPVLARGGLVLRIAAALGKGLQGFSSTQAGVEVVQELLLLPVRR